MVASGEYLKLTCFFGLLQEDVVAFCKQRAFWIAPWLLESILEGAANMFVACGFLFLGVTCSAAETSPAVAGQARVLFDTPAAEAAGKDKLDAAFDAARAVSGRNRGAELATRAVWGGSVGASEQPRLCTRTSTRLSTTISSKLLSQR